VDLGDAALEQVFAGRVFRPPADHSHLPGGQAQRWLSAVGRQRAEVAAGDFVGLAWHGLKGLAQGAIEIAFPEHQTDFECELTVVIGRAGKNIPAAEATNYVFGYTIGLDISDRDLQKTEKQFSRCKSFDTYTPIGPFVYAEVDIADLSLELRQNGEVRQRARTSQMIYPVSEIVAFASQQLTLLPGDVILTGTPSGVGPIKAGDELEAQIGDWPVLRNRIVNAPRTDETGH
jgi:2-keto-4-pentenoate hydratase/2-oxohepta-3-ene-1,7-dioic acid hydratase in catechol pathway